MEEQELHHCWIDEYDQGERNYIEGWGAAITSCKEREDGSLWASNSEYSTRVNFCPFCGYEARYKRA